MAEEKQEVNITRRRIVARIKRVEVVEKVIEKNEGDKNGELTVPDFTFIVKANEI